MKSKTASDTCPFGARVLLAHIKNLQQEIDGAKNEQDIEHIHQLRVFSRRLRSAFPLFKSCMPAKKSNRWLLEIKQITSALGQARDLDVQLEFLQQFRQTVQDKRNIPGIKRLTLRLTQKRAAVQQKVVETLDRFEKSLMVDEMSAYLLALSQSGGEEISFPVELYQLAARSISQELTTFLAYDPIVSKPECIKELHEMRIAAKALRYTIETFAVIYQSQLKSPYLAVKKSQDLLGNIHDLDVWAEFLPTFIEKETRKTKAFYGSTSAMNFIKPGLHHFLEHTQQERNRIYTQFVAEWDRWKSDGVWDDLHESIRMPTYPKDAVTPPAPEVPED